MSVLAQARFRTRPRGLSLLLVGLVLALAAGDLVPHGAVYAFIAAGLPIALYVLALLPDWVLVLMLASLAFNNSLAGTAGVVQVSASDLFLAVGLVVLLTKRAGAGRAGMDLSRLRPFLLPLGLYSSVLVVLLLAHPSSHSLLNSVQRLELSALPLVLGVVYAQSKHLDVGVIAYALGATILGLAFFVEDFGRLPRDVLGIDKNPAGQFMASAILVLIAYPRIGHRWRLLIAPLAVGLISTQSRGALLALIVALAVLVLFQQGGSRATTVVYLGILAIGLVATYHFLPSEQQARLFDTNQKTDYALSTRVDFRHDAVQLFKKHELDGVGIGNYLTGSLKEGGFTSDPHSVLYLEFAEGGVIGGGAFVLLQVWALGWLVIKRRRSQLATVALLAQVAVLTHAQFDTYWVRGTPVLGWLLIGAACGTVRPKTPAETEPLVEAEQVLVTA